MELSQTLRSERRRRQVKRPFKASLFARIAGLVQHYGLDSRFVKELDAALDRGESDFPNDMPHRKSRFEPPLFGLVTESEYEVARAILERVSSPYLSYANSPDEIPLCNLLFTVKPSLEPDLLRNRHFAELLRENPSKGNEDSNAG